MPTNHRTERRSRREKAASVPYVAVVSAVDGILFTTVEHSGTALLARLAEYVERRAETMLWPREAGRVRELIALGRLEAAIDLYFARVGDRWDREHLHRQVLEPE